MKILISLILIFTLTPLVFATTWCEWDGSKGVNCVSSKSDGVVYLPNRNIGIKDEAVLNEYGYFRKVDVLPVLGENQVRDTESWSFNENEISRTWTVRDLTATEIDQRIAGIMSLSDYLQWKALIEFTSLTGPQLRTFLETKYPDQIDAYEARERLENP